MKVSGNFHFYVILSNNRNCQEKFTYMKNSNVKNLAKELERTVDTITTVKVDISHIIADESYHATGVVTTFQHPNLYIQ